MTIASEVLAIVTRSDITAASLGYGYAIAHGGRILRFPVGHVLGRTINRDGRVSYQGVEYSDESRLDFFWHAERGARYEEAKG